MVNKEQERAGLSATLLTLAFLLASPAFVLWLAWLWFVVPFGAPPITFWHAMGIALALNYITWTQRSGDGAKKTLTPDALWDGFKARLIMTATTCLVMLLAHFLVH